MADGSARLDVTFNPNAVNGWFLRAAAKPYVEINGAEHPCRWSGSTTVAVEPGEVTVATYVIYRGTRAHLGTGSTTLQLEPGAEVRVEAKNGVMNQTPFTPHVIA